MDEIEKLQKHLPLIRKAANWSAEELGEKIGTTKQTISNLENFKSKMTKTQYLALQMVISQKIVASPEDTTLASVMKLVYKTDAAEQIDYQAIPEAMRVAEDCEEYEDFSDEDKRYKLEEMTELGATISTTVGIAGAMRLLGLSPVGAVSAAVLGATIAPWLNKAVSDDKKKEKGKRQSKSKIIKEDDINE